MKRTFGLPVRGCATICGATIFAADQVMTMLLYDNAAAMAERALRITNQRVALTVPFRLVRHRSARA